MPGDESSAALLADIDAEQLRLRELLAGKDESLLATRPPNGKWSVVENVRHLLFAEQAHLDRFVTGGREWNPFGLPPHNMEDQKRLKMLGTTDTPISDVLEAWHTIHAATAALSATDTEAVRTALQRHRRHLRAHIAVIERLLRKR